MVGIIVSVSVPSFCKILFVTEQPTLTAPISKGSGNTVRSGMADSPTKLTETNSCVGSFEPTTISAFCIFATVG